MKHATNAIGTTTALLARALLPLTLRAPQEPPAWNYEHTGDWYANITDFDISHFDLKEFGVNFALVPSMDVRLVGQGFPFEGLLATTTASVKALAGFQISADLPESDMKITVADDTGTAGEDLEVSK